MKELLENQGLCHIVRNISRYLDPKSLAQCRLVSHSWKYSIDNDRQWFILQLERIHNQEITGDEIDYVELKRHKVKTTIKVRFPEWNTFIEGVSRRQNIPMLKEICQMDVDLLQG